MILDKVRCHYTYLNEMNETDERISEIKEFRCQVTNVSMLQPILHFK